MEAAKITIRVHVIGLRAVLELARVLADDDMNADDKVALAIDILSNARPQLMESDEGAAPAPEELAALREAMAAIGRAREGG